jgi:hypothetical protein
MVAAVLIVVLIAGRARALARGPESRRTYVVQAGDTIWDIARRAAGPQSDPRPLVDRMIRMNHLGDGTIFVGERLSMPSSGQ